MSIKVIKCDYGWPWGLRNSPVGRTERDLSSQDSRTWHIETNFQPYSSVVPVFTTSHHSPSFSPSHLLPFSLLLGVGGALYRVSPNPFSLLPRGLCVKFKDRNDRRGGNGRLSSRHDTASDNLGQPSVGPQPDVGVTSRESMRPSHLRRVTWKRPMTSRRYGGRGLPCVETSLRSIWRHWALPTSSMTSLGSTHIEVRERVDVPGSWDPKMVDKDVGGGPSSRSNVSTRRMGLLQTSEG